MIQKFLREKDDILYRDNIPKDKYVKLEITLTTHCTYKCEYCSARTTSRNWGKRMPDHILKHIERTIKKSDKLFDIILFGGEPAIRNDFYEITDRFLSFKNVINVACVSNLSLSTKKYHKDMLVWGTFHISQTTPEKYLKKAIELRNKCLLFTANVIIPTEEKDFEVVKSLIISLQNEGIRVTPEFLYNAHTREFYDYSKILPKLDFIKQERNILFGDETKTYIEIVKEKRYFLKDCKCYQPGITVDVDGTVKRLCKSEYTTDIFGLEREIKKDPFITCPYVQCTYPNLFTEYKEI